MDEEVVAERPYPLSYSGVASYIWQWAANHDEWNWFVKGAVAVPAIGLAWYVVWCWSILAELLHVLYRSQGWRAAGWMLRTGIERPWFGFMLGSALATTMLLLAAVAVHPR